MKRAVFITPSDAEYGFSLTGLNHYVCTEENIEATLRNIIAEPATGLVIIDERLLTDLEEEKLNEIESSWKGVMVVLPSPEERKVEVEDYAMRLIKRAIGYHVRLQV